MKLVLLISRTNKVVRLVNVDAQNSETASERDIDCWCSPQGKYLNVTYWRNQQVNEVNPYKYNRVRIHYTVPKYNRKTVSYFCISEIIYMEDMTMERFDTSYII